jgi:hypothetical protein
MDRRAIRRSVETAVEKFLRILFFWTRTNEEFGNIVIALHLLLAASILGTLIATCLFNPPPSLLITIVIVFGLMVVQHQFLGICILSSIEKRIFGAPYPIMDPVLRAFDIPINVQTQIGVTALLISVILAILLLQLGRQLLF